MNLKPLLREYFSEQEAKSTSKYDFLPKFSRDSSLPVSIKQVPWSRTDDLEITIRFQRREDLQDFVNCYLEIEEETGVYACITIDGLNVKIFSEQKLPTRFRSMIEEIARETRGN